MRGGGALLAVSVFWIVVFAVLFKVELASVKEVSSKIVLYDINWWDAFKLSLASFGNQQTSLEGGYGAAWLAIEYDKNKPGEALVVPITVLHELKFLWGVNLAAMILGYLHLGVFLSWLFQKFSRK
jgi:hypothetical protein